MSFLSGFLKKIFQSKNKGFVAPEQQVEDGQPDADVIGPNPVQAIITLFAKNKNAASVVLSDTKPEITKVQHENPFRVSIIDAGRTLVFSPERTPHNIEQPPKGAVNKVDTVSSGIPADLPKGITADFVQQLLRKHEAEKASQPPPMTPENTFTPFMFLLTCQRCKVKGKIWIYTETYVCPECGDTMVLNEIRVDESKLKMPETEKILSEIWKNYTRDPHAKRQWDLLNATNTPTVIDLLRSISHKTQNISAIQQQLPPCKVQPEKMPFFDVTTLPELSRHTSILSERSFCYCCHMSFSYPEIMNGDTIVCPNCRSTLQLPGMIKKYYAAGDIRKDGENIPIGISKKSTSQLSLPYEVGMTLQAELDYAKKPFRNIFLSHKFDLYNKFNEFFSIGPFYKNEQAVFSLIRSYFSLYQQCRSGTNIKFFSNTIVIYENKKSQVLLLPSIVLQKIGSTINCSRLNSISVTVSENITSKLVVSAYSTSWLHPRKDGGPDRRYSYNPGKKIPAAYNLMADISYSCTLKIGHRSWVCYVMENAVEQLRSFISSWNKLSTDL